MVICVGLDGVLAHLLAPVRETLEENFGVSLPPDVCWEEMAFYLRTVNVKYLRLKKMMEDEWFWSRVPPFEEEIEAVRAWKRRGHEIHVVSGRPRHAWIPTMAWLRKHEVPHDEVAFVPTLKKYDYLSKVTASFIVEDLFYEAYKCSAWGFRSYVVRRPYNVMFEHRVLNPLCSFVDGLSEIDLEGVA